jgi:hypothetical protein
MKEALNDDSKNIEAELKLTQLKVLRDNKTEEINTVINKTLNELSHLMGCSNGPESRTVYHTMKADCIRY